MNHFHKPDRRHSGAFQKAGFLLSALILSLFATACAGSGKAQPAGPVSLYEKGMELTMQSDLLAETEEVMELYTSDPDMLEIIEDFGSLDYSQPRAVYEIGGFLEGPVNFSEIAAGLSPEVQTQLKRRMAASSYIINIINAADSVKMLAASNMLTVQESFLYSGLEEQTDYLFLYDGGYASIVTYIPFRDDVVSASVGILSGEGLADLQTPEDVSSFFAQYGLNAITVNPVEPSASR